MIRVPNLDKARDAAGAESRRTIWLVSFTDLISLLFAFFVLMFAMTEPDRPRWERMAEGLSARSTASAPSERAPDPQAAFNAATVEPQSRVSLDYLGALLRTQVADRPELAGVFVQREADRVVIAFPGELLFEHNGLVIGERGRQALHTLGAVVGRIGNRIEVVGHAEREDAASGQAWERSLGRAVAVSAALRGSGYRGDLVARSVMAPGVPRGGTRVDVVVREMEG